MPATKQRSLWETAEFSDARALWEKLLLHSHQNTLNVTTAQHVLHQKYLTNILYVFTALHKMHNTRSSDENSVRLFVVCLSVKRVHGDKTDERSVQIVIPYKISCSLVFWEPEILGQQATVGAKSPKWTTTPSEKVQLTLIGSPLCAFQWA